MQHKQELAKLREGKAEQTQKDLVLAKAQVMRLTKELVELKKIAASSIKLNQENLALTTSLHASQEDQQALSLQNTQLRNNIEQEWFIRGAGVILLGILLGLLIPKMSTRRKRSWGSF